MVRYENLSGDSGVVAYEPGQGSIVIEFRDGWKYEYDEDSAGVEAIATMLRLAREGRGLSAFVSRSARERYARKFR